MKNSFTNIDYDDISVILYRTPPLFRGAPTMPAAHKGITWLYWLAAIPVTLAAVAACGLAYLRRRRDAAACDAPARAAARIEPDGPIGVDAPNVFNAPPLPDAVATDETADATARSDAANAARASRDAPQEPRR
ncbi:type III secretion system BasJ domain protein [Burkholderia pseudomallei]|nr:type III secretion system BasJ domain protein [Burkholderia pseudomallei]